MAASYTVMPLDAATRDWLLERGVDASPDLPDGRFPTLRELRTTLEELQGVQVEFTIRTESWQATVTYPDGGWASLVVPGYLESDTEENVSREFYFEAGWEEVVQRIVKALAAKCGSLVFFSNAEIRPAIEAPSDSLR